MMISLELVVQSTSSLVLDAYCQQRVNHVVYRLVCPSLCHVTLKSGVESQSLYGANFVSCTALHFLRLRHLSVDVISAVASCTSDNFQRNSTATQVY